jgi:hypothetical protein
LTFGRRFTKEGVDAFACRSCDRFGVVNYLDLQRLTGTSSHLQRQNLSEQRHECDRAMSSPVCFRLDRYGMTH